MVYEQVARAVAITKLKGNKPVVSGRPYWKKITCPACGAVYVTHIDVPSGVVHGCADRAVHIVGPIMTVYTLK